MLLIGLGRLLQFETDSLADTDNSDPLRNIDFIRKDEGGRAVRKLHQIHMAIKIEDLAHNDRHLPKPTAARAISNRPAQMALPSMQLKSSSGH